MFRISHLHTAQSCASLPDNLFSVKLCLMPSIHPYFCLPFLLFLRTSITVTLLPTYPSSLFITSLLIYRSYNDRSMQIKQIKLPSQPNNNVTKFMIHFAVKLRDIDTSASDSIVNLGVNFDKDLSSANTPVCCCIFFMMYLRVHDTVD